MLNGFRQSKVCFESVNQTQLFAFHQVCICVDEVAEGLAAFLRIAVTTTRDKVSNLVTIAIYIELTVLHQILKMIPSLCRLFTIDAEKLF